MWQGSKHAAGIGILSLGAGFYFIPPIITIKLFQSNSETWHLH